MMFFRSGFLFSIFLLSFLSFSAYANAATVPNPPTGLTARNTGLQVTLSWTPGSDGGSAITNYKIYRNTSSPATTLLATIGNLAGYNDQTILANTTYYYRVTATNSVGEGTYSNEVNTMPQRAAINKPPNYLSSGNGLVGYWTFDGKNLKTNVTDSSGQGNNGSLMFGSSGNTSTSSMQVAGKIGQALSFDGVDDYVDVAGLTSDSNFANTTFTVTGWVSAKTGAVGAIISKDGRTNGGWYIDVGYSASKKISVTIRHNNTAGAFRSSSSVVDNGKWHHFVAIITTDTTTYTNQNMAVCNNSGSWRKLGSGASREVEVLHHGGHRV
jgi:hypothetical protein